MKIVAIGGTGLIGSKTVPILRQRGHEVIAASPQSGVNTITGEGLKETLAGHGRRRQSRISLFLRPKGNAHRIWSARSNPAAPSIGWRQWIRCRVTCFAFAAG